MDVDPARPDARDARGSQGSQHSTDLPAPVEAAADVVEEAVDIAWLLGFAQGRGVRPTRMDTWANGWLIDSVLWSGDSYGGTPSGPLPLDDLHVGDVVAQYLGIALPAFRAKAVQLRLRAMISLLLLARQRQPLESIALKCANMLEILRHNYATSVLVPAGRARIGANGDFHWPMASRGGRRMYFAEIISEFCADYGLSGWQAAFKDIRNSVVHTGEVPGSTVTDRWRNAMELMHFCDRALLAILGVHAGGFNYYRVNSNSYAPFTL